MTTGTTASDTLTPTTQDVAIDPEPASTATESPPEPTRTKSWNWKKWRARLVVVAMIALAATLGTQLAQSRSHTLAQYDLGTVTLTAEAIPVEFRQTGQVTAVYIHAQQHVAKGERIGTIVVTSTGTGGKERQQNVWLTAPAEGIVSADPTPVGGIVQPGQPFAQMYDPNSLTLETAVRNADLSQLSPGMVATLRTSGLDRPVIALVQRVVPQVEPDGASSPSSSTNRLVVVMVPKHAADVSNLVPGLRFTGTVDTGSGSATMDGLHVNG
jgi:multidrug resistance efflux pump